MNIRTFEIDIYNLKDKDYKYQFEVGADFFQNFEDSYTQEGNVLVDLLVTKHPGMLELLFDIKGTVRLTCDRSLEEYDEEINTQNRLILKFGDENKEITEEIISVTRDTHRFNTAQYIYEFIGLAIPIVKRHPKFKEENDLNSGDILIYQTGSLEDDEPEEEISDEEKPVDPRWDLLKQIKNNLN